MTRVMTLVQFAKAHGLTTTADVDSHIHASLRCRPTTKTFDRWYWRELARLQAARNETARLYREAVARGDIREPTSDESLAATAAGHPDNLSVQAARRVLAKRAARTAGGHS
jgi:hypothetical protein